METFQTELVKVLFQRFFKTRGMREGMYNTDYPMRVVCVVFAFKGK